LLGIGETVEVGKEESPFFRFYRTHTRQEAVTRPDGTVHLVPSIAFLRQVRDGQISASNLPGVAFDTARHFMMLARELLWEQIRVSEFRENPSRQRAMWLFANANNAPHWESMLKSNVTGQSQLIEVEVTGRVHECDAGLLLGDSESLDESERKARAYWRGDMLPAASQPEVLFVGSLKVVRGL
jgi:hypothetical protein